MSKIKVAVLMGGRSAEREVSLWSGQQVLNALDPEKYEAFPVDTAYLGMNVLPRTGELAEAEGAEGTAPAPGSPARIVDDAFAPPKGHPPAPSEPPFVGRNRPDVAFICLHGQYGEDGTVQGMLDLLGIPYNGSDVLASAVAMNKAMSKKLFQVDGIPTPPSVTLQGRTKADIYLRQLEAGTAPVGLPLVVKPSEQGSTIGITIVRELREMRAALDTALAYGDELLVERFVEGIEITVPVLGNAELEALPVVEIVPPEGFFDYEAKYNGSTQEIVPARISPEQTRIAQELACRAHRCLGCRGYSRTDMLVNDEGVWVLEVNTLPGMTAQSLMPRSAAAAGLPFERLVDRLLELALEGREPALDSRSETPQSEPTASAA